MEHDSTDFDTMRDLTMEHDSTDFGTMRDLTKEEGCHSILSELHQLYEQTQIIWHRFKTLLYLQYTSIQGTYDNINLMLVLSCHETKFYDVMMKAVIQSFLFYRKTFETDRRTGSIMMRSSTKVNRFQSMKQSLKQSIMQPMMRDLDTDSGGETSDSDTSYEPPSIVIQNGESLKNSLVYGGVVACLASPLIYIGIIAFMPLLLTMLVIFGPFVIISIVLGTFAIAVMQSFEPAYREEYFQSRIDVSR